MAIASYTSRLCIWTPASAVPILKIVIRHSLVDSVGFSLGIEVGLSHKQLGTLHGTRGWTPNILASQLTASLLLGSQHCMRGEGLGLAQAVQPHTLAYAFYGVG